MCIGISSVDEVVCAEKLGRFERYKPTLRAPADRHKSASEGRGGIHLHRELLAINTIDILIPSASGALDRGRRLDTLSDAVPIIGY